MTTAYLGLDLHANSSTLGVMASDGTYQGHKQFSTAESELIPRVSSIDAQEKRLAVEASELSRWAARTLEPYVDRTLVCDPWENFLISRDSRKGDVSDAYNLCRLLRLRLLRLGELKEVYQATEDHRAAFCGIARLSSGQQLRSVSVGFASRCSRIECTVPMSQPLQVNLSEEQREELIDVRDHHDKPYMREKAAAVLKVAGSPEEEGQSARQVALSGLLRERSPKAVRDWVHTYKKEGIDGFAVEEGRGQKPAFSPEQ